RTLTWVGGTPLLSGVGVLPTPIYAGPDDAPVNGSPDVFVGDDRLLMATIRSNRLWTCRNVGVNGSGGPSGADGTGCEWLEIDVSGATPVLVQDGRVYDNAATQPRFYYYPSVAVNAQGHAALGCSGSRATEFVGAYGCSRLATDPPGTMGPLS